MKHVLGGPARVGQKESQVSAGGCSLERRGVAPFVGAQHEVGHLVAKQSRPGTAAERVVIPFQVKLFHVENCRIRYGYAVDYFLGCLRTPMVPRPNDQVMLSRR